MSALTFAMSVHHFDNTVTQMKGQHRGKGVRMLGKKGKGKKREEEEEFNIHKFLMNYNCGPCCQSKLHNG